MSFGAYSTSSKETSRGKAQDTFVFCANPNPISTPVNSQTRGVHIGNGREAWQTTKKVKSHGARGTHPFTDPVNTTYMKCAYAEFYFYAYDIARKDLYYQKNFNIAPTVSY